MKPSAPFNISNSFLIKGGGLWPVFLLFTGIWGYSFAVQKDHKRVGSNSSSFLEINPSVRVSALGGDQAAAHGDLDAAYSNPAGLATLLVPQLWMTHNESLIETRYETFALGSPFGKNTLALSGQYLSDGTQERVGLDSNGSIVRGLGQFKFSTSLINVTWARRLSHRLSLGLGTKGWRDDRDGTTETGWAMDTGLLMTKAFGSLDLGLTYKNLGPSRNGFDLPGNIAIGAAYHLPFGHSLIKRTTLFSQFDLASQRDNALRLGLEMAQTNLALRAGFQNLTSDLDDPLSQFAFGVGFQLKGWKIDYALIPKGDLGDEHRIGLTIGFGLTPEERSRASKELDMAMERRIKARAQEHMAAGEQAMQNRHWKRAALRFSEALAWDPANQSAMDRLTQAKEEQSRHEAEVFHKEKPLSPVIKAEKMLLEKKLNKPAGHGVGRDNIDSLAQQAYTFYSLNRMDKAISLWKRILEIDPKNKDAKAALKGAQKKSRLLQESKEDEGPGSVRELNIEAMNAYLSGDLTGSMALWKKVLLLDPQNRWIRGNLTRVESELAAQEVSQ